MEVRPRGCEAFELGHLIFVPQILRKRARSGGKSYDAAGIEEGFLVLLGVLSREERPL